MGMSSLISTLTMVYEPPNGLPFSRRERAPTSLQKANDLAREAVGCMGVLLE